MTAADSAAHTSTAAQTSGASAGPTPELHSLVEALAERIRSSWRDLPDLAPLAVEPDLEAISGRLDGEALFIRNELWSSRGLRKLHLETARFGLGLQILHCVWFPDPRCDLPVFGADIVASPAGVSAAIVDLSPVRGVLPEGFAAALDAREQRPYRQRRELPAWGGIFSPFVLFIRPADALEEQWFVEEVGEILSILAEASRMAPLLAPDDPATVERWHGQLQYCKQQKQNDKSRRVLEKAFSPAWADRYIEELLFDDPPRP
jgi:phycocyanobilin:ferredoxin oxidoreductase